MHVIAQVRRAHATAQRTGASGPLLDRLFGVASTASRRVRSDTSLSPGSTSIPAAAIAAADRIAGPLSGRRVLIVGTGEIAKVAALNAALRGCDDVVIADSVLAHAHALADQVGGRAISLEELNAELVGADVVVAATGRRELVLTEDHAASAGAQRRGRPLAVFDLAFRATSTLRSVTCNARGC
jgi:glutamyl-tRNA reductase